MRINQILTAHVLKNPNDMNHLRKTKIIYHMHIRKLPFRITVVSLNACTILYLYRELEGNRLMSPSWLSNIFASQQYCNINATTKHISLKHKRHYTL